jgi:hypothetical protein
MIFSTSFFQFATTFGNCSIKEIFDICLAALDDKRCNSIITDSFLATKKAATTCAAKQTVRKSPTMLKSKVKGNRFFYR